MDSSVGMVDPFDSRGGRIHVSQTAGSTTERIAPTLLEPATSAEVLEQFNEYLPKTDVDRQITTHSDHEHHDQNDDGFNAFHGYRFFVTRLRHEYSVVF